MPIITLKTTDIDNKFEKTVINYTKPTTIDEMQEIINDVCCYRKAMNYYDINKRKNLLKILPSDIFLNFIIPRINFNSLNLLSQVNKYFNQKSCQNMHYDTFIKSDRFLRKRGTLLFSKSIIEIVQKSSFSLKQFDELYFNIKSQKPNIHDMGEILLKIAVIEKRHNTQNIFNKNFEIFQMLKRALHVFQQGEEKKKINNLLSHGLQNYMHALYFKRNNKILNTELIQFKNNGYYSTQRIGKFPYFFRLIESRRWEYCNMNIYNIWETMSMMHDNKYYYDEYHFHNTFESIILEPDSEYYRFNMIEKECEFIINMFELNDEFVVRKHGRTVIKYIPWHYLLKYITIIFDRIENDKRLIEFMEKIYEKAFIIKTQMENEKNFPINFKKAVLSNCNTILNKIPKAILENL